MDDVNQISYYRKTIGEFLNDSEDPCELSKIVYEEVRGCACPTGKNYDELTNKKGKRYDAELVSWKNSLPALADVLRESGIPKDCEIALEFPLDGGLFRIDAVVTGADDSGHYQALLFENKQWSSGSVSLPGDDSSHELIDESWSTSNAGGLHPSVQLLRYVRYLNTYCKYVYDDTNDKQVELFGYAYLHNYGLVDVHDDPLRDSRFQSVIDEIPLYYGLDSKGPWNSVGLALSLKEHGLHCDGGEILDALASRSQPSKAFVEALYDIFFKDDEQGLVLTDEQENAFNRLWNSVDSAIKKHEKRVIIVEGKPGTGKTVIGLDLIAKYLMEYAHDGKGAKYATKNVTPRNTTKGLLNKDMKLEKRGFSTSGLFISTVCLNSCSGLNLLVVDEAQRMQKYCWNPKTRKELPGCEQLDAALDAALCTVFFIDPRQVVTLGDAVTVDAILGAANNAQEAEDGIPVLHLRSEIRCSGGDALLDWLADTLEIEPNPGCAIPNNSGFELFDDANKLYEEVTKRNADGRTARLLAGCCWPWPYADRDNPDRTDEITGKGLTQGFRMSWNLNRCLKNGDSYVLDKGSINQVGCIYTMQGVDLDYAGVIIGNDLRYGDDGTGNEHVYVDLSRHQEDDVSLLGPYKKISNLMKNASKQEIDRTMRCIRNVYYVLLSRATSGCGIYCCDDGLRKYLAERLSS